MARKSDFDGSNLPGDYGFEDGEPSIPTKRIVRKLTYTGTVSLRITLPKVWCDANFLEAGDLVEIVNHGDHLIIRVVEA